MAKDVSIHNLEREMSILKDPPYTFVCGSHSPTISTNQQTIPYTNLLYSSTNVDGAGLDISTGLFTSGHPGSYTATWSLSAHGKERVSHVEIYLRKNGGKVAESEHFSDLTAGEGESYEQGGRTIILHLDRGDTLDLYCDNCEAGITFTPFCVSLSQFDVV